MTAPAVGNWSPLTRRGRLLARLADLRISRASFLSTWRDLADFIQPHRARFTVSDVNRGDRRSQKIIDSTGTFAKRTLSSGMQTGITSAARHWFRLTTPDPDKAEMSDVKEWLHTVTERMFTVLNRSNFYRQTTPLYDDLGTFGTGAIGMFDDPHRVVRFETYPIGSYMISVGADLKVDTFAREYKMKVREIVKQFGLARGARNYDNINWENISDTVKRLWEKGQYEQMIDVAYICQPNFGVGGTYDGISELSTNKKYKATTFEVSGEGDKVLLEEGFSEFPFFGPRWGVTGEDDYATEYPGIIALGDIKALQHGERRGAQALDKIVNPPLTAPLSARRARVSLLPGDVTYNDPRDPRTGVRPIHEVKFSLQDLEYKQEQIRQRISRAFFADLFLMLSDNAALDNAEKTATEIAERKEEKLLALGPLLESLNGDFLDPMVDRLYNMMDRADLIPPAPEALSGEDLKVEYISIMAQAQKMVGLGALERTANFAVSLATATGDPGDMDKLDIDELIDAHAGMTGVPPQVIRTDEEVQQRRGDRAKQQQAQQQAAMAEQMSKSAKNLAQSDTGGQNALTDLLRAAGAGSPTVPGSPLAQPQQVQQVA